MNYFDMLNGVIYPALVKEFWLGATVVTKEDAQRKYDEKVAEDPDRNKGKSREELGLEPFTNNTVIRSTILGMPVSITRNNISELLQIPNNGYFLIDTDKAPLMTKYRSLIKERLYEDPKDMGKTYGMHMYVKLLHRILLQQ
jgi:hypothetical protein